MRLTRRQRDEAVTLLRGMADLVAARTARIGVATEIAAALNLSPTVLWAYTEAYMAVDRVGIGQPWRGGYSGWRNGLLEAAALLEDGWNPGDPVELIGGAK
jgi:hypothetical protein